MYNPHVKMLAKANLVDEMTSNDYDTMAPSESECPTRIKSQFVCTCTNVAVGMDAIMRI